MGASYSANKGKEEDDIVEVKNVGKSKQEERSKIENNSSAMTKVNTLEKPATSNGLEMQRHSTEMAAVPIPWETSTFNSLEMQRHSTAMAAGPVPWEPSTSNGFGSNGYQYPTYHYQPPTNTKWPQPYFQNQNTSGIVTCGSPLCTSVVKKLQADRRFIRKLKNEKKLQDNIEEQQKELENLKKKLKQMTLMAEY